MKYKKIIIASLLVILFFIVATTIYYSNKLSINALTVNDFTNNFNKASNNKLAPLNKYLESSKDNRVTYKFKEDFYMVLTSEKDLVKKVYYYINKDTKIKDIEGLLLPLISSINPRLTIAETSDIAHDMCDINNKKSDQDGFLVNFKKDNYNYMTLVKENGKYLQFFIYTP